MFKSKIFLCWFIGMLVVWAGLFYTYNHVEFLLEHWYYPTIMVLGAFVAGLTPEGGGAVAFPVLSVFLNIDRVLARDFSLMIQSIGMTSASVYILSNRDNDLKAYKPLLWFVPICFVGFVIGMLTLQQMPVFVIQGLFLSLITTFALAYYKSNHRGHRPRLEAKGKVDHLRLLIILLLGGMCASLFGTGADIILYTLLVTRFRLKEKVATHLSIMVMASISVLGYLYRHYIDHGLSSYQVQTWLCAYPVVLFMAPFGTYILSKIHVDWMLKGIVILNIGQLAYFNLNKPTMGKTAVSIAFCAVLWMIFRRTLARLAPAPTHDQDSANSTGEAELGEPTVP
jgi:uncharacterized membrane protein YfcA